MIRVGRINNGGFYIGRPSGLGNPFLMCNESERSIVCELYEYWLREELNNPLSDATKYFYELYEEAKKGDIILECYCAPKQCHGDIIKKLMEENLLDEIQ